MTVTTIDCTPTWDAATRVYLEVLRVNEWYSEPSKRAREELQRMAKAYDQAKIWIKEQREKEYDWCSCNLDTESAYTFHVPANRFCALCKSTNERLDHYHCGVCIKLTQVG